MELLKILMLYVLLLLRLLLCLLLVLMLVLVLLLLLKLLVIVRGTWLPSIGLGSGRIYHLMALLRLVLMLR